MGRAKGAGEGEAVMVVNEFMPVMAWFGSRYPQCYMIILTPRYAYLEPKLRQLGLLQTIMYPNFIMFLIASARSLRIRSNR